MVEQFRIGSDRLQNASLRRQVAEQNAGSTGVRDGFASGANDFIVEHFRTGQLIAQRWPTDRRAVQMQQIGQS